MDEEPTYICGSCGAENIFSSLISDSSTVKCGVCQYRILYKKRKRRLVRLIAR